MVEVEIVLQQHFMVILNLLHYQLLEMEQNLEIYLNLFQISTTEIFQFSKRISLVVDTIIQVHQLLTMITYNT